MVCIEDATVFFKLLDSSEQRLILMFTSKTFQRVTVRVFQTQLN